MSDFIARAFIISFLILYAVVFLAIVPLDARKLFKRLAQGLSDGLWLAGRLSRRLNVFDHHRNAH